MSRGLLVLGAHRSGTSALSRVLNLCGASLGDRLMGAAQGNEAGHWESAQAVAIDEALLQALDRRWNDLRPLPEGWAESAAADVATRAIADFAAAQLRAHPLWAIKDPRLCRLLPVWRKGLTQAGLEPAAVIIYRHPAEVAASLAARNGMARDEAMWLWWLHLADAIVGSRGLPRCVLSYDELLTDWRGTMARIAASTGVALDLSTQARFVDEFLAQDLRNHALPTAALPAAVDDLLRTLVAAREQPLALDDYAAGVARFASVVDLQGRALGDAWAALDAIAWQEQAQKLAQPEASPPATTLARALADQADQLARLAASDTTAESTSSADLREAARRAREHQARADALETELAQLGRAHRELLSRQQQQTATVSALRARVQRLQRKADLFAVLGGRAPWPTGALTRRLKAWRERKTTDATPFAPALSTQPNRLPALPPVREDTADVFLWCPQDWAQLDANTQTAARTRAAEGGRVFVMARAVIPHDQPGFHVEALPSVPGALQINLFAPQVPLVSPLEASAFAALRASLGELLAWTQSERTQSWGGDAHWRDLADCLPNQIHVAGEGASLAELPLSIVISTRDQLPFLRACLRSLDELSDYPAPEIIVVDNASRDGTADFLASWAAQRRHERRVITNADDRGQVVARNQGLQLARGDGLVLLTADSFVTAGWLRTLVAHLRRAPRRGLVLPTGPADGAGIDYADLDTMAVLARAFTARHAGLAQPLERATLHCALLRRAAFAEVGPFDESFAAGGFEDEDYCRRLRERGWQIARAEDVFVHHHAAPAFDPFEAARREQRLQADRAAFERKWGPSPSRELDRA